MRCAERITDPVAHHGEGPFWDERNRRLLCVDLMAGVVVAVGSDGGISRYDIPSRVVTVIRRRASGGYVLAIERGMVACDDRFSVFEPIADLPDDPVVRTNDGGCDPLGGFIIGTMAYNERTGAGTVYRLTPDHQIDELLSPVSISNGVQWSVDGTRVYYVDTPTRRVDAFDVDPGTAAWSARRAHISIDEPAGFPDGMAIDEENGLWVALWRGGAVNHYDGDGRFVEGFDVPGVSQVTSCAFGGDDRSVLYITTSRQGLPEDHEPDAGAVFAVDTQSRGTVPFDYAG